MSETVVFALPVNDWPKPDVAWMERPAKDVFGDEILPSLIDQTSNAGAAVLTLLVAARRPDTAEAASNVLTEIVFPWLHSNPCSIPNIDEFQHDWQDLPLRALSDLPQRIADVLEDAGILTIGALADAVDSLLYAGDDRMCQAYALEAGCDIETATDQIDDWLKAVLVAVFAHRDRWLRPAWMPAESVEPAPALEAPKPEAPTVLTDHEKLLKINEAAERANEANAKYIEAKEKASELKKMAEAADAWLRRVIADVNQPDKPMPLFDKPKAAEHVPAKAKADTAVQITDAEMNEMPITRLVGEGSVADYLLDAGISTVGAFAQYQRDKGDFWDKDLKIDGRRKPKNFRQIVEDSWITFWATAGGTEPAAAPAA